MPVSRPNSEMPSIEDPKQGGPQREKKDSPQGRRTSQGEETPLWEKLAGLAGLLLFLGVLGFLLYEASRPQTEAEIVTEQEAVIRQEGGYLVSFKASNQGRQTAAAVLLEGALYDPASPGEPLETAEVTFDYIPDQSARSGAFVFEHDPSQYELRIQVKGFMDP